MPHFCRICHRYRANERFSGKGHKQHVCEACARLPLKERRGVEQLDELEGMLEQSNISKKNLARLRQLLATADPGVADLANLVLEIALAAPHKRKRLSLLAERRPDLMKELERRGMTEPPPVGDWPPLPDGPAAEEEELDFEDEPRPPTSLPDADDDDWVDLPF